MNSTWFSSLGVLFTGIGFNGTLATLSTQIPEHIRYARITVEPSDANIFTETTPNELVNALLGNTNVHVVFTFVPATSLKNENNRITGTAALASLTAMVVQGVEWIRRYGFAYSRFSIEVLSEPDAVENLYGYMTPFDHARLCSDIFDAVDPEVNLIGPALSRLPTNRDLYIEALFQCKTVIKAWSVHAHGTANEIKDALPVTTATMNSVNINNSKFVTTFDTTVDPMAKLAYFLANGYSAAFSENNIIPEPLSRFARDCPCPGLMYRSEELSPEDRTVKILVSSTDSRRLHFVFIRPNANDGSHGELRLVVQNKLWNTLDKIVNVEFTAHNADVSGIRYTYEMRTGQLHLTLNRVPYDGAIITCTFNIQAPLIVEEEPGNEEEPVGEDPPRLVTLQTIVQLPVINGLPTRITYIDGTIVYDSSTDTIQAFWNGTWHETRMLQYV